MQFSVVNFHKVYSQINSRFDAEYWHPEAIEIAKIIGHKMDLGSCIKEGYRVVYENTEVLRINEANRMGLPKFIQAADINPPMINIETAGYVREEDWQRYPKGRIQRGEILLEVKGDVKKVAIVPDDSPDKVLVSGTLYKFRVNEEKVNKYFLATYLSCSYGQKLKDRLVSNIATPFISKRELHTIPVPCLGKQIQNKIEQTYTQAFNRQRISQTSYAQAQNLLLAELGLADWQPRRQLTFVKNYSDTEQVGRIDADYFQPKYEEIVNAIKGYAGGWDILGDLVTVKKCVEVGSNEYLDEGVPFVRVSNLSTFEITEEKYISDKLYKEMKQHQPEKEEILFSKDGTPGIAYLFNEAPQKMIPSSGILRLKNATQKVNNEYLILVLNSLLIKEQISRDVGGSIILHWRPDQVKRAIIPILPEAKQAQIQKKVTESFNLRKQSKCLLKCAKKAVEIAIEQDEKTAIARLKDCLASKVS